MVSGQHTVRVAVNVFDVPNDLVKPDQSGEPVKESLLQRVPRMFMEIGEERAERVGDTTKGRERG